MPPGDGPRARVQTVVLTKETRYPPLERELLTPFELVSYCVTSRLLFLILRNVGKSRQATCRRVSKDEAPTGDSVASWFETRAKSRAPHHEELVTQQD